MVLLHGGGQTGDCIGQQFELIFNIISRNASGLRGSRPVVNGPDGDEDDERKICEHCEEDTPFGAEDLGMAVGDEGLTEERL